MSTPIDQVREVIRYRELRYEARDEKRLTAALVSVLRDAERFRALERGHAESKWSGWAEWNHDVDAFEKVGPLAELADRLREEAQ